MRSFGMSISWVMSSLFVMTRMNRVPAFTLSSAGSNESLVIVSGTSVCGWPMAARARAPSPYKPTATVRAEQATHRFIQASIPSSLAPRRSLAGQLDERAREGRLPRLADEVGRRALGDEPASVQHEHPGGNLGLVDQMRRPQHAQLTAPAERQHVLEQRPPRGGIEAHRRLVHDQNPR